MERQSPQWNHWILCSHMHSDQNYVIKKYSKTLRLGKLLSLMIFSRALDAGSTITVGPSTYSPMSCVQSHACSWMSMVVCLLKSNKYILFKYLGVFETEPVDPDILTVNVQQLLYHILWPYGATTTGSIASHQSCLNVYLSAKDDKRMRKSGSTTVEMWKQQAHVGHRLADILFLSRSWINRRCAFDPQAEEADIITVSYALEDALSGKNIIKVLSDDIDVLVLPVYLCHDKALRYKLQMESWDSTGLDINVTCVELSKKGLQLPGM